MEQKKTFRTNGPDAIEKIEEEVEKWLEEMDDKIEIIDIEEFEDENEQGKIAIVTITYQDLPPES